MFVCKQIFLHGQELFRCVGQLTQECEVEGDSRWGRNEFVDNGAPPDGAFFTRGWGVNGTG